MLLAEVRCLATVIPRGTEVLSAFEVRAPVGRDGAEHCAARDPESRSTSEQTFEIRNNAAARPNCVYLVGNESPDGRDN